MISISRSKLKNLLFSFKGKKILIIGDLMLDEYIWGKVGRISPEAPVPIVEAISESVHLGGAANVALNISVLGGEPILIGVIGKDRLGESLKAELKRHKINTSGIFTDRERQTTLKTRVIAHHQHVVRIDRESKSDISKKIETRLNDFLKKNIPISDGILIEDYNKGVLTKNIIHETISLSKKHNKLITVDPKFNHFFEFKGVTVFKPNQTEVETALGIRITNEHSLINAGHLLKERLNGSSILITRGEHGMTLFDHTGEVTHVETSAKEVFDVSGAGDTTISVLTLSLSAGASLKEAATIANRAAGVEVSKIGIVPVTPKELWTSFFPIK